jgi:hypothetical protein
VGRVDCRSLDFDEARSTRSAQVTERCVTGLHAVTGRDAKVSSDPLPPSEIVFVPESPVDVACDDPGGENVEKGIMVERDKAGAVAMARFT